MRSRFLTLCGVFLATVFIVGCNGKTPVSPSATPGIAASTAPERVPVPLVGEGSGQSWQGSEICAAGTSQAHPVTLTAVTGNFTHLGLTKMASRHCYVSRNPDGSLVYMGTAVLTAANGDEVHLTYTGSLFLTFGQPVMSDMTVAVVGGTGRFAEASRDGVATIEVALVQPSGPWAARFAMKGAIVY